MMQRKRPTISDVADAAGVSVGTVSNYLNGTANVRPATKLRIDDAVRRLAYRPSTFARSLSVSMPARAAVDSTVMPRLIVVGYISVDYMCRVDVLPHRDDRITAHYIEKGLGGPAANLAVAAAGIGANGTFGLEVELATALGLDPDSDWAIAELSAKGVHALAIRQPANSRLSRCIVFIEPNGSRTIVNEPFELSGIDLTHYFDIEKAERPSCLHIEGYHYERLSDSIERFREAGWMVSLHSAGLPTSARTPWGFRELVARLDLVFAGDALVRTIFDIPSSVSGPELVRAVGAQIMDMPERGHFVMTLGPLGAAVFPGDGEPAFVVSALPVHPVDATGAGDSFAGSFLAYWLNGSQLANAARYAAACASLTVTAEGAQGLTASHEDLLKALSDHPPRTAS
jgi:sugar/nucleoside kinase (ribokinase family)